MKRWKQDAVSAGDEAVIQSARGLAHSPAMAGLAREGGGQGIHGRSDFAGFTLVELLVVMAIIGVLAGMLLYLGPAVSNMRTRKLIHAQMEQLITVIDSYKEAKGFYPPDSPNNFYRNTLYYELTGANPLSQADIQNIFGIGGILNSQQGGESKNFFKNIKDNQFRTVQINNVPVQILAVKTSGINPFNWAWSNYTPWHYRVAKPVDPNIAPGSAADPNRGMHNLHSYDLWVEAMVNGKTITFGNWKEGQ